MEFTVADKGYLKIVQNISTGDFIAIAPEGRGNPDLSAGELDTFLKSSEIHSVLKTKEFNFVKGTENHFPRYESQDAKVYIIRDQIVVYPNNGNPLFFLELSAFEAN